MCSLLANPAALSPPIADRPRHETRSLAVANALLLLAVSLRISLDVTREWGAPTGLPLQLWASAIALVAIIALAFTLAIRDDRRAPGAAMLGGFMVCIGGLLVQAGPPWGPLTQFSFWAHGGRTDTLSWVLLTSVFLVGLGPGLLAVRAGSRAYDADIGGAR